MFRTTEIGIWGLVASVLLWLPVLNAQTKESRHHEAHEHGVAHLNVAVDGADLYLEFISPAANIVGFEHPPRNDAQKAAVKKAVDTLKNGKAMIILPSDVRGKLAESTVETDIDELGEHDHHSEFKAEYHFVCENPDKLEYIDVLLLRTFSGIERIEVQLLTGTKQAALELTAKKNRISFAR
jgi:hypothetical protein